MLTAKNVSPIRAIEYFVQGYYQQGTSRWYGQGAQKLELVGEINDQQVFAHIVNGRSFDGNQQLCSRTVSASERRAGTDFTFSAPKSVSLTALVGGDERLKVAHQIAVEKTLSLIEQRYAHTRVTLDKQRQTIHTGNLVIAEFDHIESRELDPHLHTHCLVMNMTQYSDGNWYSHLNDAIFRHKKHLGMIYQSYLAHEVQKLGYEIEQKLHGQFEIKGYNEHDLVEFSKRRQQILAVATSNSNWLEREKAWDVTRKNKQVVQSEDLKFKWRQEALARGINFVQPGQLKPEHQQQPVSISNLSDAIAHCCERNVAFYTEDLERFILEQNLATDITELEPLIQQQQSLICIDQQNRYFTTHAAVQRELATIRLMQNGQGKVNAICQIEDVDRLLEATSLNPGQRQAVQLAVTTTDQFIAWQGVAGAGKTFALKELKAIANSNGYTVKGFAPSAIAAKVLGDELNIQTETVGRLLVAEVKSEIQPNQVWIVDEASLVSAKDAFALLEKATDEQARVVFVGDTRQLSAVEAGNPFKSLQQAGIKTAYLNESNRQRTPQLKLVVDLIANGRIADGFARLDENGCIQTVTADEQVYAIANDYMSATPEQRAKTLVLASTNAQRLVLTRTIRNQMKALGSLGEQATATQLQAKDLTRVQMRYTHNFEIGDMVMPTRNYKRRGLNKGELYEVIGKSHDTLTLKAADSRHLQVDTGFDKAVYQPQQIEIAVGDRLRWTKNDRQFGRRNGQEFVVTAIEGNIATIKYEDSTHTQTIDLTKAQHLDYAIVSTIYSSQGKTADRVIIASDYTIATESFYVALSRAKYELKLYTQDKSKLLELAQRTKAQKNPLELLRLQEQLRLTNHSSESVVSNVVVNEKPISEQVLPSPILKSEFPRLEESSATILQPTQKQTTQPIIPTETFWVPSNTSNIPAHIEPQHWLELVKDSLIHPDIAALNFKSLKLDTLEQEHEAWAHLFYSDKLERSNTGRLTSSMLRKYSHIDSGGWWCDAGVDPRSFSTTLPGHKPQSKIWGCFKPNQPRENPDKPGKKIKYEHPPKADLSIFLLDVPEAIANRIYEKAKVNPTQNERDSGFWYCVHKYNLPIIITEGAKKAASLLSQGHAAIGLPGIYAGYRSKDEQGNEIKAYEGFLGGGEPLYDELQVSTSMHGDTKAPLLPDKMRRLHDELAVFATPDRDIKICFDYETRPDTKRNIDIAISRTGSLLQRSGAKVSVVTLPGPDKGVDDLIVAQGGLAYKKLHIEAKSLKDWRDYNKQQQLQKPKPTSTASLEQPSQQTPLKVIAPIPLQPEVLTSADYSPTEEITNSLDHIINDHPLTEQLHHQEHDQHNTSNSTIQKAQKDLTDHSHQSSDQQLIHKQHLLHESAEHDTEQYHQGIIFAIKQLSNPKLLSLANYVTNYFSTSISRPPKEAQKHFINSEINRLSLHIDQLWSQYHQLDKYIQSIQHNPFRTFNRKYSDALSQSIQTLEHISGALAQKKQFEEQLQQWKQHVIAHQSWLTDPKTAQMKDIAQALNLPEIQQQLAAAKHEKQLQRSQWQAEYRRSIEASQNQYHHRSFRR